MKSAVSDVQLWGRRFFHMGIIIFVVGGTVVYHLDLKESKYVLIAAYVFLANDRIVALILFAALCMSDEDRKTRSRSSSPPRTFPAWMKPDHMLRMNRDIMTAENAAAVLDQLRPTIMFRSKHRSMTFEWTIDNDMGYILWLLRDKQTDPSHEMLLNCYSLLNYLSGAMPQVSDALGSAQLFFCVQCSLMRASPRAHLCLGRAIMIVRGRLCLGRERRVCLEPRARSPGKRGARSRCDTLAILWVYMCTWPSAQALCATMESAH